MKTNWQTKKLGEVLDIQNGYAFKSSSYVLTGSRVIRISNVQSGQIVDKNPKFVALDEKKEYLDFQIYENDILISLTGDVGRVGIFPKNLLPALLNQRVGKIININNEVISKEYLFLFLNSKYFENEVIKGAEGAAQKNTSTKKIKNIEIPIPSLSEQKKILKTLDGVFEKVGKAKENAEKNLKNSKELFESCLQGVFANPDEGWEICELNDHVKFIDYRGRTPQKTTSGLRLITAKNIKMGFLQKIPEEFIDPNDYEGWMTRGIPNKGDVLFTTEAPLANVAQLDTDEKVAFAQRTIILQADPKKINSTFLKYLLLSNPIQKRILEKGTGATVQGIKASLLKKIEIYFPKSLAEQKAIVKKLDALSGETKRLEAIYKQKIADLDELKKSVLQKAFAGEL